MSIDAYQRLNFKYYLINSSLEAMNTCTIIKSLSIRLLKYTTMYNEIWDLDKNNNTSELTLTA